MRILIYALPSYLNVTVHDPVCFVVGIQALMCILRTYRRFSSILRHRNILFTRIPLKGYLLGIFFWGQLKHFICD